jgi:hypothetical protein
MSPRSIPLDWSPTLSRQDDTPHVTKSAGPPPLPPRPPKRLDPILVVNIDGHSAHDRPTPRSTVIPRLPAPSPLPAMRPRLETLIFHGAPPLAPATPRPPRDGYPPYRPIETPYGRPMRPAPHDDAEVDGPNDGSVELVDDASRPSPMYAPHDHDREARDTPSCEPKVARSDRPPSLEAGAGGHQARSAGSWRWVALAAASVLAVGWHVAVGRVAREMLAPAEPASASPRAAASVRAPSPPRPQPIDGCVVAGAPRLVARRAMVRGGVEVTSLESRLGLAVVTGAREGTAFELDAASLSVIGSSKVIASDPLRRVVPSLVPDVPLDARVDLDAMRSVADGDGDSAIGTRGGHLVWASRDTDSEARLWPLAPLGGRGDAEAPRVVSLGASGERAVTFRRGGAIWIGAFRAGDAAPTMAPRARVSDGAQVGAPAIDAFAGEAIVAWTQREGVSAPWTVRWMRWRPGTLVEKPRALSLPPGGPGERAIAPSVAALEGGRFLLAWTEGAATRHQVRAQAFDANDRPVGEPMSVSPPEVVAGQEQVAVTAGGRGVVAFLSAKGHAFELLATPITCSAPAAAPASASSPARPASTPTDI